MAAAANLATTPQGYIKVKSVNGTFQAGENIQIRGVTVCVCNSIPLNNYWIPAAGQRAWLELMVVEGTTHTVPRLGKFEFNGSTIFIGRTNGAVGQQITAPYAMDFPAIWVETAENSGTYEIYLNAGTTKNVASVLGGDSRLKTFTCTTAGLITIPNATAGIGYQPDANLRIYVPNIFVSECTAAAIGTVALPAAFGTRAKLTTTSAGKVIMKGVSCNGLYMATAQSYQTDLQYFSTFTAINVSEVASPLSWNEVAIGIIAAQNTMTFQLKQCYAGGSINNMICLSYGNATAATNVVTPVAGTSVDINSVYDLAFTGYFYSYILTGGTTVTVSNGYVAHGAVQDSIRFFQSVNVTMDKVYLCGARAHFIGSLGVTINNVYYSDVVFGPTQTSSNDALVIDTKSADIKIMGFNHWNGIIPNTTLKIPNCTSSATTLTATGTDLIKLGVRSGMAVAGPGTALGCHVTAVTWGTNTVITGTTWAGGVATFKTNTAHGWTVGTKVHVYGVVSGTSLTQTSWNGTFVITSVNNPNTQSFTVDMPTNPGTWTSGGTIRAETGSVVTTTTSLAATATACSWANNIATITISHNLVPGQTFTLSGMVPAAYNGTWQVLSSVGTAPANTGLTFYLPAAVSPGAWTSGGTITSAAQELWFFNQSGPSGVVLNSSVNDRISIWNIGTPTSPYECSPQRPMTGISIVAAGASAGPSSSIEFKRCYFKNFKSSLTVPSITNITPIQTIDNASTKVLIQNMWFQEDNFVPTEITGTTYKTNAILGNAGLNVIYKGCYLGDEPHKILPGGTVGPNTGVPLLAFGYQSVYGQIFADAFTSSTTGRLHLLFNEKTPWALLGDGITAPYSIKSGTPNFTSNGQLFMPTVGDSVEYEWPYYVLGYTGPTTGTSADMIQVSTGALAAAATNRHTLAITSSAWATTGIVTHTTATHAFKAGDKVVISGSSVAGYNGTFIITSVPSTTTFTVYYPTTLAAGTGGLANTGTVLVTGSWAGGVSTYTSTTPHALEVGAMVHVRGMSVAGYNGNFIVASTPTNLTFTVAYATTLAAGTGGTAWYGNYGISTTNTSTQPILTGTAWAANEITFTTAAHNYVVGQEVTITNCFPPDYNGIYTIKRIPLTTTFVVDKLTNPGVWVSGGFAEVLLSVGDIIQGDGVPVCTQVSSVHSSTTLSATRLMDYKLANTAAQQYWVSKLDRFNFTYDLNRGTGWSGVYKNLLLPKAGAYTTVGSAILTLDDTTGVAVGDYIFMASVPVGTTVLTVDSATQITMSSGSGVTDMKNPVAITSSAWTGGVSTYTTTLCHELITGQKIVISGSSVAGYNGIFTITSTPTVNTFTVAYATTLAAGTGGLAALRTPVFFSAWHAEASFNPNTGFKPRIRITANKSGLMNFISNFALPLMTDATSQQVQYPLETKQLGIYGLTTGSRIAVMSTNGTSTNYDDDIILAETSYSANYFTYDYEWTGVPKIVNIIIIHDTNGVIRYDNQSLGGSGATYILQPQLDRQYLNPL